jgi:hypothetical protein
MLCCNRVSIITMLQVGAADPEEASEEGSEENTEEHTEEPSANESPMDTDDLVLDTEAHSDNAEGMCINL